MLSIRKLLNKPKPTDTCPLAVFYYCDVAVIQQMEALNHLMRTTPDNLGRRSVLIRQLKEAQHNLMSVILGIVEEAVGSRLRAPRDFRVKYPDDVLVDQINGPIWFGAECIAAGSHIANHEPESEELRPHATQLSKSIAKVRNALREQCFTNRGSYPQKLKELLLLFDAQWADFEFRYVSLMCSVKSEEQYDQQQDVIILFCESTLRALRKNYISSDMMEMMDPSVMFAIPRLAIVCGLVVYTKGPLDTSKGHKDMPLFFKGYRKLLMRIKELLGYLTSEQLTTLEQALCSAEGLGTLNRKKLQRESEPRPRRRLSDPGEPTAATDGPSHLRPQPPTDGSIQRRSYNMDSRAAVFEPDPVTEARSFEASEEPGFPNLGVDHPIVNELPSSGGRSGRNRSETHSMATSTGATAAASSYELTNSSVEPKHNLPSAATTVTSTPPPAPPSSSSESQSTRAKSPAKTGRRSKGPGGFASAEDLMHRLFVTISGVADQLQTNHAKEIRVILKHVFTICQSEPEPLPVSQGDKCPSEPCTLEPQSPLIASSVAQSFNFSTSSLSLSDGPSWVPDSDCPACSNCQQRFSWRRRRHHCRNCGQVVCATCSRNTVPLPSIGFAKPARVCTQCYLQHLGRAARMSADLTQSVQVY